MRESAIEKEVCQYAKSLGYLEFKLSSNYHIGLPDRLFISPMGYIFFIEFKAPGGKPRKIQEVVINRIRSKGAEVFVVNNIEMGKRIIDAKKNTTS